MPPVPRPTRPALSREFILDQALGLIDQEGLGSFSMRRLAARVGVDPMAFYHYFPQKAALFDGVVEAVYLEAVTGPPLDTLPARDQVIEAVYALRKAFLRHPRVLPLLATRPARTPGVLVLVERFLGALEGTGLPRGQALDAVTCLTVFTIGHALAEAGEPLGGEAGPEVSPVLGPGLPRLAAALEAGPPFDMDRQFHWGLQAMVNGLLAAT